MKKKIWKQIIAAIMACALITSTAGTNTALAAVNKGNITATSLPVKVSGKNAKESSIARNIKPEERTPELDRILRECKEVKIDETSDESVREIRRGEILSVESILGDDTKMVIMSNGDLYCWGNNRYGQVGNGTTENQLTPYKVLSGVKTVTYSRNDYVSAITENGDLYCWGYNHNGEVGNGTTENQLIPYKILSGVKNIPSLTVSSAITENGDLYCWGYNEWGIVGNGTTENQLTPYKVLSGVKKIYNPIGYGCISAITENGDLYCWGDNNNGMAGSGTTEDLQLTPYKVLSGVKTVTYSECCDCVSAITENDDLYCWGDNKYGQVGNGTTVDQLTPYKVLSGVKTIIYHKDADYNHFVSVITENGDLYCWGYNYYGQIGNGTTENQLTPYKVLSKVKTVPYFLNFRCMSAITENDDLYCWGDNEYGIVGNGTTENQLTPYKVIGEVKSITYERVYGNTVSVITKNDDLYCWGENNCGVLGNGTTENQLTPYRVLSKVKELIHYDGRSISAITENGDLYCWGYNHYGQIGNGTTENQLTPYKVLSKVKTAIYDNGQTYGVSMSTITENGDLYYWGYNGADLNGMEEKQLTPYKVLNGVKTISSVYPLIAITENDDLYCCKELSGFMPLYKALSEAKIITCNNFFISVITKEGDLYCWGDNRYGQVGNGTTEDQLTPYKVSFEDSSDDIAHFTLSETANATLNDNDSSFTFSGHIYLKDGKTASKEQWQSIADSIQWTSSDPSVVTDIKCQPVTDESNEYGDIEITVSVSLKSIGTATVTGTTKYGVSSDCNITVKEDEEDKEICHVTGILKEVDLNNLTVTIGGTEYEVTDLLDISKVYGILSGDGSKTVVAVLVDGKINKVDSVEDIVEPKVNILVEPDSINYHDGVFDNTQVKIKVLLSCGAKLPYKDSDIKNTDAENISVNLSEYILQLPEGLEFKELLSSNRVFTGKISDVVKMGIVKEYEQTVYVTKNYIPEKVKDSFYITAIVKGNGQETYSDGCLSVVNLDKGTDSSPSQSPSPSSKPSGSGTSTGGGSFGGGGGVVTSPSSTPVATATPSPDATATTEPVPTPAATLLTPAPTPVINPAPTSKPSSGTTSGNGSDSIFDNNSKKEITYADVILDKKTLIYNGKEKKPEVTVLNNSLELTKNKDYTVSYYNNINIGTAYVTVYGEGNYYGSVTKSFKIIPKGTSLKGKAEPKHKGFTVKWKKQPDFITGYQIQYSTSKKFKGKITVIKTVKKKSVTKLTAGKLKAKKKYYVRVRTYKTVKGKRYYSRWSKFKVVKTKK